MDKLNILFTDSLEIYGGGEFFVYILAKYLQSSCHNIFISCPENSLLNKKCSGIGIKVFHLDYPKKGTGNLSRIIGGLKRIIKNENIQIVHSNTNYDRTASAFATIGTHANHAASIHSYYSIQRNLTHLIRNKYYIKQFIASGEKIKQLLMKNDRIPEDKITSINLGIDINEMKRDKVKRKTRREIFNISDNEIVIGNVGRLVEFKGQENLIRGFALLNKKHPNTKLIITGSGELESKLKLVCSELSVDDKVIFTGFIEKLDEIYSAFDIYVHSSVPGTEELFPFAILNAMAHELPVIATDTGEINKMVSKENNGFLINNNEPELIAEKIEILVLNKEKRISFGSESLKIVKEKFTLEQMGSHILNIYEKIL